MSLTGSSHDGDDLVQIALERGLANIDRWRPGTRMESWLLRIAYNAWVDDVRMRKRRGVHLDVDAMVDLAGGDARKEAYGSLEIAALREAMAELSEEYRAVIILVAIEGLSYQETADALKIPIGTVMSRLSRARARLAEKLDNSGARSDD